MKSTYIITPNYFPDICGIGDYSSFLYKNLMQDGVDTRIITFSENTVQSDDLLLIKRADNNKLSSWLKVLKSSKNVQTIIFQYEPYSFSKKGIPVYLIYIFICLKIKGYNITIMFHEVATRLRVTNPVKIAISLLQLTIAYAITALSNTRFTSTNFNAKQLKPFELKLLPIPSNFLKYNSNNFHDPNFVGIGCFANRVDSFFTTVIKSILATKTCTVYLIGKQNSKNDAAWENSGIKNYDNLVVTGTLSTSGIEECLNKLMLFLHLEKIDDKGRGGASLKNGSLAAAMEWGLPVITSKGDMTDTHFLQDKKNIYFVDNPRKQSDWVNAVDELLNNDNLRFAMQKNAKEFYNSNLSWPTITKQYLDVIRET